MVQVCVLGAINWDTSIFVKDLPRVGEEVKVERIMSIPGGKAANVAVAVTRLLGSTTTVLIGALGNDSIGREQARILSEEGIDTSYIKFADVESGRAYVLIDSEGRNMINTFFGANATLFPEDISDERVLRMIRKARVIVVMDPPLEVCRESVRLAKQMGKMVLCDFGVRSKLGMEVLKDVISMTDYLLLNRIEVEGLTGSDDPVDACKKLSGLNDNLRLAVKLGEDGCVMTHGTESVSVEGIKLKEFELKPVNTVGCGDAFVGAFAASKAEGLSDNDALKRANLAGAFKAIGFETRSSPSKSDLEDFASRIGLDWREK